MPRLTNLNPNLFTLIKIPYEYARTNVVIKETLTPVSYMDWLLAAVSHAKSKDKGQLIFPEDAEQKGEIKIYQTGRIGAIPEDFVERLQKVLPTIEEMDSTVSDVLKVVFIEKEDSE